MRPKANQAPDVWSTNHCQEVDLALDSALMDMLICNSANSSENDKKEGLESDLPVALVETLLGDFPIDVSFI